MARNMNTFANEELLAAIQPIYQLSWANIAEEHGKPLPAGSDICDVCPRGESGPLISIARTWVDSIERQVGSLSAIFGQCKVPSHDHGQALYYLFMECLGHGVGFGDYAYGHGLEDPFQGDTRLPDLNDWEVYELACGDYDFQS